jgi:hypothetical protein
MSIDRSEKHKIERLAKMVPIPSPECRAGIHGSCPGVRAVVLGGVIERVERPGMKEAWVPDSIEAPCGCACHKREAES